MLLGECRKYQILMAVGKGIFLMFNIGILTVLIVVHWISKYKYVQSH